MRVLFATSEAYPLIKTGGLADVSGALPAALGALGIDVRILIPGYRQVLESASLEPSTDMFALLPDAPPARLLQGEMPECGTPLYVLDCPALFERDGGPYQDPQGQDWPDNALRFGALSRMAARFGEETNGLDWAPELIHCHDWQTALTPAYLAFSPESRPPTVMTVHNIAFAGVFPASVVPALGLPWESFTMHGLEFYGQLSFLKAGLFYADHITTVSPGYAAEIQTEAYGAGLHGLLSNRHNALTGIMNGIDTSQWNPATDPNLPAHYDVGNLAGKATNKRALQRRLGLEPNADTPLVGMVTRLTLQKGIDTIIPVMQGLRGQDVQFAILGSGEKDFESELQIAADESPQQVSVTLGYDESLAHQIEAGADIFLMPSRFEPCGLNQMYSMRYGTPPLVRRTGGLGDSVTDTTQTTLRNGTATGFVFEDADPDQLMTCLQRTLRHYAERKTWHQIQTNGMQRDFSWSKSAELYVGVYRGVLAGA